MSSKLLSWDETAEAMRTCRESGGTVVFTNGCFDLLHVGHVRYLSEARSLGDLLVIGLNSDAGVRHLKGANRPITPLAQRAEVLTALRCVDVVTSFDEDTPLELIRRLLPDVLVKGGDWPIERIVGREVVETAGGRVLSIPFVAGISTTGIATRIADVFGNDER